MNLNGKVAIVAGASRSIGKAMPMERTMDGAQVEVTARSEELCPMLPGVRSSGKFIPQPRPSKLRLLPRQRDRAMPLASSEMCTDVSPSCNTWRQFVVRFSVKISSSQHVSLFSTTHSKN
jgi:hypothetical protein